MSTNKTFSVFITWSGRIARATAKLLIEWIPQVLPSVEPTSSFDIDKGEEFFIRIVKDLKQANFGIICVSSENLLEPWIYFESGVLSRSPNKLRVATFLIGIKPKDLPKPMFFFQATESDIKDDVRKLISTINALLEKDTATEATLNNRFNKYWKEIEGDLRSSARSSRIMYGKLQRAIRGNKSDDIISAWSRYRPIMESPYRDDPKALRPTVETKNSRSTERTLNLKAIKRMKLMNKWLRDGKNELQGWTTRPGTDEFNEMIDAEKDNSRWPLEIGDRVYIQRFTKDKANGSMGIISEKILNGQHYKVKLYGPEGSPYYEDFHVMYLTRAELIESQTD